MDFYELMPDEQAVKIESLVFKATTHWGITNPGVALLKYRENAVYAITDPGTGSKYAMRIHRPDYHTDDALRSELQFMKALDDAGIHTPPVIPTQDGELFITVSHPDVPEPRQVDILGWVEGEPIGTIENDAGASLEEVRKNHIIAGKIAARIHNFTQTWEVPQGFSRRHWDEEGLYGDQGHFGCFRKFNMLTDDQRALLVKARDAVSKELAAFGKSPDRYGLTHADFLPENLLADGEDVRIIDFDDCGFGWHLMDIATSLFFLIGEEPYDAAYEGIIEGYRSERDLPDDHLVLLPTFFLARGLNYLAWLESRQETETAKELGPVILEGVCALAEDYLS